MNERAPSAGPPPAPRGSGELPAPPEPPPVEDSPEALTLEGLSVHPNPGEVASGRGLDAAHTNHDDVSGPQPDTAAHPQGRP
jgi:hypothetical protein